MRKLYLAAACLALLVGTPGDASAAVLFGVSLNGHRETNPGPSSLYRIDPVTGSGTLIGNLEYAINSITIDPTTGLMYGSTTTWSGAFNGLLLIDPTTGAATEIGAFGDEFIAIIGLTSDSAGNLYGWHETAADSLVTINKTTGAATQVGASGLSTGGSVLAFDSQDNLILVDSGKIYDINTTTGLPTFIDGLSFDEGGGGAAFDFSTGLLWAPGDKALFQDSFIRVTDLANNSFIDIDTDVEYLSAVTWGDVAAVNVVPEPTTIALLGIGAAVGGIGLARRRQREAR